MYYKDAETLLFGSFELSFEDEKKVVCKAFGGQLGDCKAEGVDIKAVTFHNYSVKKEGDEWVAHVIVDI